MSDRQLNPDVCNELPKAKLERNWKTYLFWLVPIAAACLAAYFIYSDLAAHGPTLHVFFDNAKGIQPGKSEVKYRGARIGMVTDVRLTPDHRKVEIVMDLDSSGASLAREGSRFWIVRPELGASGIRGLRTIVSGDYITVEPGGGKARTRFEGLAQPPVIETGPTLSIMLFTERVGSLKQRSPVFYRGIQVGEVVAYHLGPDSQMVEAAVHIQQRFAPLVRMNSKFWNAGGINLSLGFSGADISAKSVQTLLSGGIAFATPTVPGNEVAPGTSFRLYDKPEDQWLSWSPVISLTNGVDDIQTSINNSSE